MAGDLRLVIVLSAILAVSSAQDISKLSPLYFPDGGTPPVHQEESIFYEQGNLKIGQSEHSEWHLPKNISPQRYYLFLDINPEQKVFSGNVKITFTCSAPTQHVTLHGANLDIVSFSNFREYFKPNTQLESVLEKDIEHQTLTFTLEKELVQGLMYEVHIEFRGQFSNELNGLYRSNYTQNGETRHLAVTHFEPFRARLMFPCFDEPDLKATFYVRVKHPKKYTALSNTPLLEKTVYDSTSFLSKFEPTVRMSTYLLAVVVSQYQNYSEGNTFANIWAREDIIASAAFSQKLAESALQRLENYTAIRYPIKKMDHVAIPHFGAGAMENYGLITYREEYLSLYGNTTKTLTKVYTVNVIAHELAHQWFGNLVTLKWWSYTWLNEAFATFVSYYLPGEDLSWRIREQFIPAQYQYGMEADQDLLRSVAMTSEVEVPNEIAAKFDKISYAKGASVLRMFNKLLGDEVFQEAIQQYLITRSYLNAEPNHLFSEIAKVSHKSANALPKGLDWLKLGGSWTEQAGVPLVRAERNYETGEVKVTQSRFCVGGCTEDDLNVRWWIPIAWKSQSDKDQHKNGSEGYHPQLWLSGEDEKEVKFKTNATSKQWILINPKAIGYFRVTYDNQNWNLLADDLLKNTKSFSTEDRAQILHDVMYLALANKLSFSVALNSTLFLQNDDDFVVWMSAVKVIRKLYDIVGPTDAYFAFTKYAQKLIGTAFAKVGLQPPEASTEAVENTILRAYIAPYACMFGDVKCLKESKGLLEKLLSDSSVHPDVETAAACGGVQGGDAALFWRVRQKAIDHRRPNVQAVLLAALACSKDNNLIKEHLTKSINDATFPKGKIYPAITSVVRSLTKFNVGLEFIQENFKKILKLTNTNFASRLVQEVVLQIRTVAQYKKVEKWLTTLASNVNNLSTLKLLLKVSLSVVNENAGLHSDIVPWLRELTRTPRTNS